MDMYSPKARFILPANFDDTWLFLQQMLQELSTVSTVANYSLQICDVKICFAFALAGSVHIVYVNRPKQALVQVIVLNL